jgi:hypothetical protein
VAEAAPAAAGDHRERGIEDLDEFSAGGGAAPVVGDLQHVDLSDEADEDRLCVALDVPGEEQAAPTPGELHDQ